MERLLHRTLVHLVRYCANGQKIQKRYVIGVERQSINLFGEPDLVCIFITTCNLDKHLMTLGEYYKKAILYPSFVTVFVTIVFSIIANYNYKSEWVTADAVIALSIFTAIIYCLIISVLSTTIFLNRFAKIRDSSILNFLTWFLLPFGFIATILVHEINFKIKYNEKFGDDFIYVVILNFPSIIGLIWTYSKYKKITCRNEKN